MSETKEQQAIRIVKEYKEGKPVLPEELQESLQTVLEQAEKYRKIADTWLDNKDDINYPTIFFLRVCKEVIENFEIEKKKSMI